MESLQRQKYNSPLIMKYLDIFKILFILCGILTFQSANAEWQSRYYTDEFGDVMYDHPYEETHIPGVGHSFSLYIRLISNPAVAFELVLARSSGFVKAWADFNTNSISVKDAYGNVTTIDIPEDHGADGRLYITGDDAVRFAQAIDNGNCKINLTTVTYLDTYRNPGKYLFASGSETKGVLAMLYANAIYNDYVEEEPASQSPSNFKGSYIFKGYIGGASSVTMKLTFDGAGKVTGTCKSGADRVWNRLEGSLSSNGEMSIAEYGSGGAYEWEYVGQFDGKEFRGECIDPDRGTSERFFVLIQKN